MKLLAKVFCLGLLLSAGLAVPGEVPTQDEVRRFQEIQAKQNGGQRLTPEEQEFAQRMMARLREQYAQEHPSHESTGLIPLTDMGQETYQGNDGGLYAGGANSPPSAHLNAGLEIARGLVPRDQEGRPAKDGKFVLVSIGMSNTTMEFQTFQTLATGLDLNPHLVIVDGAQGGQTAQVTADPQARYWQVVEDRLNRAGVSAKQVAVAWIKQATPGPSHGFPGEAKGLEAYLVETLHNLHGRFPNLKIAYLSSRIYAGYAMTPLNPEPYAYETAFAVKWLIADQIAGKPELNFDSRRGAVESPWLAWGPYLWTDGVKGRKDGLVWRREDVAEDGTHPSPSGREKVARMLVDFLKSDPTARLWSGK
jgi:hypothetical protein